MEVIDTQFSMLSSSSAMLGEHPSIKKIYEIIQRVAATDVTILLTGESGTGKELVARAIHNFSLRADRPFVPVNCAAIPENLLESELFGHARGAFTGAHSSRAGLFQLANHGTILLDEVGELPLALQAKLLRVLQDGKVRPIGTDHPVEVQVRVIASTNKDLAHQVEKGSFREDLFFRLQVIPLHLPPLRARRSDIPLLVNHFLDRSTRKHGVSVRISREAMIYLWEYDVGFWLMSHPHRWPTLTRLHWGGDFRHHWRMLLTVGKPLLLGSVVCSAPFALVSFFITRKIMTRHHRKRAEQERKEAAAKLEEPDIADEV